MNIQQRLTTLERQVATGELNSMPTKPSNWTDGEYTAVVKGLGLMGQLKLSINEVFIAKYKTYIDKILAEYNNEGITPNRCEIKAEPVSYSDVIEYERKRYEL